MTRLLRFVLVAAAVLSAAVVGTTGYPAAYEIHYRLSTTQVVCLPAGTHASDYGYAVESLRRVPSEDWSCVAGADESTN